MKQILAMFVVAAAMCAFAAEKPRIFITDSKSWEMGGGGGGSAGGFGGSSAGGARPQTAEIVKTFGERCDKVIINNKQEVADYVVVLDHEGGKGIIMHDNKIAVFNRAGDAIFSRSTRSLGNLVKDSCEAIIRDWWAHGSTPAPPLTAAAGASVAAAPASEPAQAKRVDSEQVFIEVSANQDVADIEIDGNFVGTTPSKIGLTPGQHTVIVRKSGFKPWERRMSVSAGDIRVTATLEPN